MMNDNLNFSQALIIDKKETRWWKSEENLKRYDDEKNSENKNIKNIEEESPSDKENIYSSMTIQKFSNRQKIHKKKTRSWKSEENLKRNDNKKNSEIQNIKNIEEENSSDKENIHPSITIQAFSHKPKIHKKKTRLWKSEENLKRNDDEKISENKNIKTIDEEIPPYRENIHSLITIQKFSHRLKIHKKKTRSWKSEENLKRNDDKNNSQNKNIKDIEEENIHSSTIILPPFRLEKVGPFWKLIPELVLPRTPCLTPNFHKSDAPQSDNCEENEVKTILNITQKEQVFMNNNIINVVKNVLKKKKSINITQKKQVFVNNNISANFVENELEKKKCRAENLNGYDIQDEELRVRQDFLTYRTDKISLMLTNFEKFIENNSTDEDAIYKEIMLILRMLRRFYFFEDCHLYVACIINHLAGCYKSFLDLSKTSTRANGVATYIFFEICIYILVLIQMSNRRCFENMDNILQKILGNLKVVLFRFMSVVAEEVFDITGCRIQNIFHRCFEREVGYVATGDMSDFVEMSKFIYHTIDEVSQRMLCSTLKRHPPTSGELDLERVKNTAEIIFRQHMTFHSNLVKDLTRDRRYFYDETYFDDGELWVFFLFFVANGTCL